MQDESCCAESDSELPTGTEFAGDLTMERMLDRIFIPEIRFLEPRGESEGQTGASPDLFGKWIVSVSFKAIVPGRLVCYV